MLVFVSSTWRRRTSAPAVISSFLPARAGAAWSPEQHESCGCRGDLEAGTAEDRHGVRIGPRDISLDSVVQPVLGQSEALGDLGHRSPYRIGRLGDRVDV